jgi:hypothetical protein
MESAQKIKRIQAESDAARHLGGLDLTLLPSASARDQQSASPTSAPPGENGTNVPSKPELRTPVDRPTIGKRLVPDVDRPTIGKRMACRHGIESHQCPMCAELGEY